MPQHNYPKPGISHCPPDVLPDFARLALLQKREEGIVVDAYPKQLLPDSYQGWNIECHWPPGRKDCRWRPFEWVEFVKQGMVLRTCDACDDIPGLFDFTWESATHSERATLKLCANCWVGARWFEHPSFIIRCPDCQQIRATVQGLTVCPECHFKRQEVR